MTATKKSTISKAREGLPLYREAVEAALQNGKPVDYEEENARTFLASQGFSAAATLRGALWSNAAIKREAGALAAEYDDLADQLVRPRAGRPPARGAAADRVLRVRLTEAEEAQIRERAPEGNVSAAVLGALRAAKLLD